MRRGENGFGLYVNKRKWCCNHRTPNHISSDGVVTNCCFTFDL